MDDGSRPLHGASCYRSKDRLAGAFGGSAITLDFSASENTQVLEPAGTSGLSVAVPLRGGAKTFCAKVGPVDATKSSSVQMGIQMQQTAGTPNPPAAAGGASAPAAAAGGGGGGTFDAAAFEFSAGVNKKEIRCARSEFGGGRSACPWASSHLAGFSSNSRRLRSRTAECELPAAAKHMWTFR